MLKKLYFVADVMERYRCRTRETARRYMRQMGATGSPLFVTEDMINAWEMSKRKPVPSTGIPGVMKIPRRK